MKSRRTQALSIPCAVKHEVRERDGGRCILCGRPGFPEAHYIPRSAGGLGIEENVVTLCRDCHNRLDQTTERTKLLEEVKAHLDIWYPGFPDEKRVFRKGERT